MPYNLGKLYRYWKQCKGSQCLFENIHEKYNRSEVVVAMSELPEFLIPCTNHSGIPEYNEFLCGENSEFNEYSIKKLILSPSTYDYVNVSRILKVVEQPLCTCRVIFTLYIKISDISHVVIESFLPDNKWMWQCENTNDPKMTEQESAQIHFDQV